MKQQERDELKRLVAACSTKPSLELCPDVYDEKWPCELGAGHWGKHKSGGFQWLRKDEKRPSPLATFHKSATPTAVLDLLAENQRVRELLEHGVRLGNPINKKNMTYWQREVDAFLAEPK